MQNLNVCNYNMHTLNEDCYQDLSQYLVNYSLKTNIHEILYFLTKHHADNMIFTMYILIYF